MQALTIAYEERDERSILSFYGLAIALTVGVGLFAVLSLFLIAVLPAIIDTLPLSELWRGRPCSLPRPPPPALPPPPFGPPLPPAPPPRPPRRACLRPAPHPAAPLLRVCSARVLLL